MALRFDDTARTLTLSVLDLVEKGILSGHLRLDVVQAGATRLAQGRAVHEELQALREAEDDDYRSEVRLKHTVGIGDWTITLVGRVDGLSHEGERTIVEEIKSTALDAGSLYATEARHWPKYVAQLEVYLWMLHKAKKPNPVGRLALVSLLDGARHVLGVPLDPDRLDGFVMDRLHHLVEERERRLTWLAGRRERDVAPPFDAWRPGQEGISDEVAAALDEGRRILVEAPTGLGKTAAVMHGVLRHAFRTDKQVFWATARTTQQEVVERTAALFGLRVVTLTAKEKACIHEVVACNPEVCPFAARYFDKLHGGDVVERVLQGHTIDRVTLREAGRTFELCPYQLSLDVLRRADLVVGDYNYAFDPGAASARLLGEDASSWVVVADEAHQLVDRARGYGSPSLPMSLAVAAEAALDADPAYARFAEVAARVGEVVREAGWQVEGPVREGKAQVELSPRPWMQLADELDEIGLDYARLRAERPLFEPGEVDPWQELARAVLRFARTLEASGSETAHLVDVRPGREAVSLLCLDPSGWIGPRLQAFGGFAGCSATLSPVAFYRDLLGLGDVTHVPVPSPFPPENRKVVVAPRVSTLYRDRDTHAERTAKLLQDCVEAMPGPAAAYFPSFAMLRDIVSRWSFEREVLEQQPGMDEDTRRAWLARLAGGEQLVLAAVLGGIFAEGIDLGPGALSGVLVCGPALPPVGLERDLLRACYEERYGEGFRYASLVPGMTKVVQAAGRLVRTPEDRGVVVLVGKRFRWREYAGLLPEHWNVEIPNDPVEAVRGFWP